MENMSGFAKVLVLAVLAAPVCCLARGAGPGGGGGPHAGAGHAGEGAHGAVAGGSHGGVASSGHYGGGASYGAHYGGGASYGGHFGGGGHLWRGGYPGGYGGAWRRNGWGGRYFGGGLIYGSFYDPWFWPGYGVDYAPSTLLLDPPALEPAPQSDFVYRFFCPTSRDYYPSVQTCTVPWLRVVPGD